MRVLFIADIVGADAIDWLAGRLPELRSSTNADVIIANAENSAQTAPHPYIGFGMVEEGARKLFAAGVDVVTSGNHAWDTPVTSAALSLDRVIRPHNVGADKPGIGYLTIDVDGEPLTVLSMADTVAIPGVEHPHTAFNNLDLPGTVVVDFHSGDVMQILGFGYANQGKVAAVFGTHTHEPTELLHLTDEGTAIVVDVGMTGPSGGWQGIDPKILTATYLGKDTSQFEPFQLAIGPMILGAVLVEIQNGKTTHIERVR